MHIDRKLHELIAVMFSIFIFCTACETAIQPVAPADNPHVIWIGDSIFSWSEIAQNLESDQLAGETYRHYYGTLVKLEAIRRQYDRAMQDDPDVRTIIMDGGGDDVILGNLLPCSSNWRYSPNATTSDAKSALQPTCIDVADEAGDTFEKLVTDAFDAGIKHIVYVGYYYLVGLLNQYDAVVKYHDDSIHQRIQELNTLYATEDRRIVFVDQRDTFLNRIGLISSIDGIHPTSAGAKVSANLIWKAMQDNCIEQPDDCVPIAVDR